MAQMHGRPFFITYRNAWYKAIAADPFTAFFAYARLIPISVTWPLISLQISDMINQPLYLLNTSKVIRENWLYDEHQTALKAYSSG